MKIADMKVTELINEIGLGTPAPGGGAVAGLAGGVGVALTMMVSGLTLTRTGFEEDHDRLLDAIAKGNELKERFIDVMNRDSEVFDTLIESLALPKDDDAHKAIRRGAVQEPHRHDEPERRQRPRHRSPHAQDRHAERLAQRAHQPQVAQGPRVCRRVLEARSGADGPRHPARQGEL